jgi:hypothetical protein
VFFAARVNIILSMRRKTFFLVIVMVALAACTPAGPGDMTDSTAVTTVVLSTETAPPTLGATTTGAVAQSPTPATTATSTQTKLTATPAELPTATPTPDPVSAVTFGRTDEGAYFHGAPDAPVTLIDYSDFL